jgi:hypothetical protein
MELDEAICIRGRSNASEQNISVFPNMEPATVMLL